MVLIAALLPLAGCGNFGSDHETSYNEGFAAGYDGACAAQENPAARDWSNTSYSDGYQAGYSQGSLNCATADTELR